MREFTKSMLSFSWAMSLFGVQQMANLLTRQDPNQPRHKATQAFDDLTGATEQQFGDMLGETFKSGDKLQRGMVDMMFGLLTLQMFNPNRMAQAGAMGMGMPSSADCCGQSRQRDGGSQQQATGWGPVPPPGTAPM